MKIVCDREVIKDCIHDLFVKIYTHRQSLSMTDNINIYLIRSLRNIIYNFIRDELSAENNLVGRPSAEAFDEHDLIEELFPETDTDLRRKQQLMQVLNTLSKKQREIVYLRFVQDLSYEQIADILSINYQSVKNLFHRTMVKMRTTWVEDFPEGHADERD
jgi:RNA polymerase sigma-70 factor (ECF subfamily)